MTPLPHSLEQSVGRRGFMDNCRGHLCTVCNRRWRFVNSSQTCLEESLSCNECFGGEDVTGDWCSGWEWEDDFRDFVIQTRKEAGVV